MCGDPADAPRTPLRAKARRRAELLKIAKTSPGADGILHYPPETFDGVEVVPTMGGYEMEAKLVMVVLKGRVELVCPMNPAAINDHHDLFPVFWKVAITWCR